MAFVDDATYHVSYASGELTHDIFKIFFKQNFPPLQELLCVPWNSRVKKVTNYLFI